MTTKFKLKFIILGIIVLFASCNFFREKPEEKIKNLVMHFYKYAMEDKEDSIKYIYPSIDLEFLPIRCDSFAIKEIIKENDSIFDVLIIQNYSPDNSEDNNIKRSITLIFEKCDSLKNGYVIKDSKGLFVDVSRKYSMEQCGSIKKGKKYFDMEYQKRWYITKEIYRAKANEIAEYLNKNINILFTMTNAFGEKFALIDRSSNKVNFTLENNTDYPCLGFTIYMSVANCWSGKYEGKISGRYDYDDAMLDAHSEKYYCLTFDCEKDLKVTDSNWKSVISEASFKITPEDVLKHTPIICNGNEYNQYMSSHKTK
jgi:hypothetical protein